MDFINEFKKDISEQEYLTVWEDMGFLEGLTPEEKEKGSKVYTNLANYIMENKLEDSLFSTIGFPIVRKVLTDNPDLGVKDFDMETIYTICSDVFEPSCAFFEPLCDKYKFDFVSELARMTARLIENNLKINKDND